MAFFCLQDSQHSRAAERYWPSKPCRGERNFWMQRRAAEISLRDRKCHQRPKERNNTDENPHRNGPFGAGREICGLEGLDGGRDGDRTCDPLPVRAQNYDQKRFPTMAVSHAIAALEARHETKLFDRIGRRIALTEACRVFLMEARAILARAGAAELAQSEFGTLKRGTLCVQARNDRRLQASAPSGGISARLSPPLDTAPLIRAPEGLYPSYLCAAQRTLRTSPPPQGARPVPHGLPVGFADHALGLPVFRDVPRDRAVWRGKDRGSIPARYL